ncbi:MAG: hypothetical protein ABH844_02970 [Candidatus Omnitrophota bacterium]
MDFKTLEQAWIKQGHDLPIVTREGSGDKKAKDGRFYTLFPPLLYRDWKDNLFSDTNTKRLLNEAKAKSRFKNDDDKNIVQKLKYFANKEPIVDVSPQLQKAFGKEVWDIDPRKFPLIIDKLRGLENKSRIASEILRFFANIAVSETAIIVCKPEYAPLFALNIVDLEQQRKCPIKKCTHGRKCIIESSSYIGKRHIYGWEEKMRTSRLYSLIPKECKHTKQPYIVEVRLTATFIFDYLFHLNKGKCLLCGSDNNHFIAEKKTFKNFKNFKCNQCGNEFVVYDGGWKFQGPNSYIDCDSVDGINRSYLIGCKILGLIPKDFKRYKAMCWSYSKKEISTFFEEINIRYRKNLASFLNKEIDNINLKGNNKFADEDVYKVLKEYDCILE